MLQGNMDRASEMMESAYRHSDMIITMVWSYYKLLAALMIGRWLTYLDKICLGRDLKTSPSLFSLTYRIWAKRRGSPSDQMKGISVTRRWWPKRLFAYDLGRKEEDETVGPNLM